MQPSSHTQAKSSKKQQVKRTLLIIAGTICLALGVIGIVLPILPTTPFLLLAAACYLRSSERLHKWLLNNRWCGEYIKNYQQGKGVPLKTKIAALTILWVTILYSTFFVVHEILIAQIVLLAVAVGVSVHLIRMPTFKCQREKSLVC
ncbi:MAG: YbaN family protein [Candidatus Bathyarchaeota archaeon]|nr:YbaN family protein [Candidatus Bathyarchaeota archaeon]